MVWVQDKRMEKGGPGTRAEKEKTEARSDLRDWSNDNSETRKKKV